MPYKQNNKKAAHILMIMLVLFLFATQGFAQTTSTATGRRVALVVGNGAYESNPLRNPPNDADDVSAALKDAGFEVTVIKDADQSAFERAVNDFASRLRGADTGLFYYAGHGVQVDGVNYLIPVRPRIDNATDVKLRAVAVDAVVARMEQSGVRTALVFLDSCRDNPFPGASRSGSRGLAVVPTPKTTNSLIAYATAPGDVAADGTGRNGVFSGAFITQLQVPGQELSELMRKVRAEVAAVTGGRQNPRVDDGMKESFYFVSPEQMAARAEAALRANQEEIAKLEKELAERQAQINATRDAQAKQALEVEQQRQQALATAKRLETESLAREAERQRRLADEASRAAAERAALAAEQARQQSDLAAIAASRRAELERLARDSASDNPDVLIETIERLDKVLAEVASEYAAAWRSIEAKLREGYQPRLAAFTAAKPEIWETDAEFRARIQRERSALERDIEATVAACKSELEAEQRRQTESMRKQYDDALATLARKTWILSGKDVALTVSEYDRNNRKWIFILESLNKSIPVWPIRLELIIDASNRELITEVYNSINSNGLVGAIEWSISRSSSESIYKVIFRRAAIINLITNKEIVSTEQGKSSVIAQFQPNKRMNPEIKWAIYKLNIEDGVRVFYGEKEVMSNKMLITDQNFIIVRKEGGGYEAFQRINGDLGKITEKKIKLVPPSVFVLDPYFGITGSSMGVDASDPYEVLGFDIGLDFYYIGSAASLELERSGLEFISSGYGYFGFAPFIRFAPSFVLKYGESSDRANPGIDFNLYAGVSIINAPGAVLQFGFGPSFGSGLVNQHWRLMGFLGYLYFGMGLELCFDHNLKFYGIGFSYSIKPLVYGWRHETKAK